MKPENAVFNDRGQFGGGKAHNGGTQAHGFTDRQSEAGIADGMEEEAVAGNQFRQFLVGDFS